jgi:hypothetical protein
VYVYFSDPNKSDSDGDSVKDGAEIVACLDPITSGTSTMISSRLSQITGSIALKPLKEPTIATLKAAGASASDLQKGVVESKCKSTSVTVDTGNAV